MQPSESDSGGTPPHNWLHLARRSPSDPCRQIIPIIGTDTTVLSPVLLPPLTAVSGPSPPGQRHAECSPSDCAVTLPARNQLRLFITGRIACRLYLIVTAVATQAQLSSYSTGVSQLTLNKYHCKYKLDVPVPCTAPNGNVVRYLAEQLGD